MLANIPKTRNIGNSIVVSCPSIKKGHLLVIFIVFKHFLFACYTTTIFTYYHDLHLIKYLEPQSFSNSGVLATDKKVNFKPVVNY